MLVYKNDYITIDAEKVNMYVQPMQDVIEWQSIEQERYCNTWLMFHFTVQCNWKIKRSSINVDISKHWENTASSNSVNWYYIINYDQLYLPLQLLSDLWYDVPTEMNANKIADKAMQIFN